MDIHKPKAAHSIREFLVEIGTITIGILIALSLEALIEAHRNHELVEHARADLRNELIYNRKNLADVASKQKALLASLQQMIAYGKQRVMGAKADEPADLNLSATFSVMSTSAWESTLATQALAHMPYDEAKALARVYAGSQAFNTFEAEAERHWFDLSSYAEMTKSLTPDETRVAMREALLNQQYQQSLSIAVDQLAHGYDAAIKALGPG